MQCKMHFKLYDKNNLFYFFILNLILYFSKKCIFDNVIQKLLLIFSRTYIE